MYRALMALCVLSLCSAPAFAQEQSGGDDARVPSTAAAAEAYDRGSAFYLNGDYARAAEWFVTAYRLAPAPPALMQALRAQMRAGERLGAGNLALRLGGLHGDNPEARALADEVIAEMDSEFVRLDVDCSDCRLQIGERVWSYPAAFLAPATEHNVLITRGDDRERHSVTGDAGEHLVLGPPPVRTIAPPVVEPPVVEPPIVDPPVVEPPVVEPPRVLEEDGFRGPPPWVFGIAAGLTVVSAGLLIGSGIDTLSGLDDYNRMPTEEAFLEGEAKELRTNVFIATTVGLGLLSAVLALVVEWTPTRRVLETVGVSFDDHGAGAWLRARF